MAFGLHYDIPDRALPDALRTLLVQQATALEALVSHTQHTVNVMRESAELAEPDKAERLAALAHDVSEQLTGLEEQRSQIEQNIREFQGLLRQQGNPILAYTLARVEEVLASNFARAQQHLDAIIRGPTL